VAGELPGPQFPYQGVRVTPNVYTTLEEVDTFVEAMRDVLENGLPTRAPTCAARSPGTDGDHHDEAWTSQKTGAKAGRWCSSTTGRSEAPVRVRRHHRRCLDAVSVG